MPSKESNPPQNGPENYYDAAEMTGDYFPYFVPFKARYLISRWITFTFDNKEIIQDPIELEHITVKFVDQFLKYEGPGSKSTTAREAVAKQMKTNPSYFYKFRNDLQTGEYFEKDALALALTHALYDSWVEDPPPKDVNPFFVLARRLYDVEGSHGPDLAKCRLRLALHEYMHLGSRRRPSASKIENALQKLAEKKALEAAESLSVPTNMNSES